MDKTETDLLQRVAERVRTLRTTRKLTLDDLAQRSGVSRSMISLVERGESSPTAVLLERLATGLGVPLARLFEPAPSQAHPVSRRADQPQWRDPASGYLRRNVSPGSFASPIEIVEVEFPPGARVAFENGRREDIVHQQVWILGGTMDVTSGDTTYRLDTGDCFAFTLVRPTSFHNPTTKTARYAVVITTEADRIR